MGADVESAVDALIGDARSIADLTEAMARIAAHLTGGNYELSPGDPVDIVGHLAAVVDCVGFIATQIAPGHMHTSVIVDGTNRLIAELVRIKQELRAKGASA